MLEFFQNNLSFTLFILFLTVFLFYKRKRVEVQGSFPFLYMIMYKTKLGLDKMDKWSKKHPNIFLYLGHLSVFIGILGIFASIAMMFWGIQFTLDNNLGSGGGLVLPIKTDAGLDGAVPVFYVPFWYWLLALFVLVVVHEFAHGVIAQRFGIKVKSSGFAFGALFLPIMPAAFVEPDEKQMAKASWYHQIAVFGAGSTSNFLFGFLFLFIWIFGAGALIDNTMEINTIQFINVDNQSDLYNYNISQGKILSLNGETNNENIFDNLRNLSINESINMSILDTQTNKTKEVTITTLENEAREGYGRVGITLDTSNMLITKDEYSVIGKFPLYFERLFFYLWMLNIGIGIMNLLPIWITDGGQIAKILLLRRFKEKTAMSIYNYISLLSLVLIIFTIWPSTIIWLITFFPF